MNGERGVAVILVVMLGSFLSVVALGLALVVFVNQLATGNFQSSVALLHAAEAGIDLAAQDVAREGDWSRLLSGQQPSSLTDGAAGGVRAIPGGGTVDLTAATNLLNCARTSGCAPAQMDLSTRERPWGVNNPRWRPYIYGPWGGLVPLARPVPGYLVVWIGDDGRETDGEPLVDAPDASQPSAGVIRVRAEAYGLGGLRRAVEAEFVRICVPDPSDAATCRTRIRVQSWQELRQSVP